MHATHQTHSVLFGKVWKKNIMCDVHLNGMRATEANNDKTKYKLLLNSDGKFISRIPSPNYITYFPYH